VAAIKAAIGVVLANEPPNMPLALHRLLGNVDLAADELAALIDDLLEIARLQAGRVELWRTAVDLRDLVTRAVRANEPLLNVRQQRAEVFLPEGPVTAPVDAERLGRVLRSLLGNAQKYGRQGGAVGVRLERCADQVCLSVADDGPGIPPEDQNGSSSASIASATRPQPVRSAADWDWRSRVGWWSCTAADCGSKARLARAARSASRYLALDPPSHPLGLAHNHPTGRGPRPGVSSHLSTSVSSTAMGGSDDLSTVHLTVRAERVR
jgi:hypothetical protein